MDWTDWHQRYDTSDSLAARLNIVREQVVAAIDECPVGPVTIVSLCAGDGRDVIAALTEHPRREDASAWLLDTHLESLVRGEAMAEQARIAGQVRFIQADAGLAASYAGLAPADIVLLSGFLGHIRREDIPCLIANLPMLCKTQGFVIWNKHLVANGGPATVPAIREKLESVRFEEVYFQATGPEGYAVGRACFRGKSIELEPARLLFEFVNDIPLDSK